MQAPTRQQLSTSSTPGNRLLLPSSAPQAPPPRYNPPPATRRSLGEYIWRQADAHAMPCRAPALSPIQASRERLGCRRPLRACHALGSTRDHSRAQAGEARQRASLHRSLHTTSKGPAGHGAAVLSRGTALLQCAPSRLSCAPPLERAELPPPGPCALAGGALGPLPGRVPLQASRACSPAGGVLRSWLAHAVPPPSPPPVPARLEVTRSPAPAVRRTLCG